MEIPLLIITQKQNKILQKFQRFQFVMISALIRKKQLENKGLENKIALLKKLVSLSYVLKITEMLN